jgi:hypothetical protein
MEEKLWKIFDTVNSWLRYSENKNAYILAFIAAQITLAKFLSVDVDIWLKISFFFLGLCFLVCMISFFPKTALPRWLFYIAESHKKPADDDNLLFYGHIAKYSINQYIEKMSKYLNVEIQGNEYLKQLCAQVVINAGIANTKFNMFKFSFWLLLLGQIFFVISILAK